VEYGTGESEGEGEEEGEAEGVDCVDESSEDWRAISVESVDQWLMSPGPDESKKSTGTRVERSRVSFGAIRRGEEGDEQDGNGDDDSSDSGVFGSGNALSAIDSQQQATRRTVARVPRCSRHGEMERISASELADGGPTSTHGADHGSDLGPRQSAVSRRRLMTEPRIFVTPLFSL
jgi:hypothetical protein